MKTRLPPPFRLRALFGVFGLGATFLGVAYLGRSSTLFVLLIGISTAFISQCKLTPRELLHSMITPFLPFVLLVIPLAFLQPKISDAFWLLSIPASYVFARLLRAQFSINVLAGGALIVGVIMGAIRAGSSLATGDIAWALSKLLDVHHKNPVGWAIAMGLISAFFIARQLYRPVWIAIFCWICVTGLSILLLLSDSLTAVIAAIAGLVVMGFFSHSFQNRFGKREFDKAWKSVTLGFATAFATLVAVANFFEFHFSNPLSQLAREPNLTGRTTIWGCYVEAKNSGVEQVQRYVWECSGVESNLHSSFLEAHFFGGWPLLLTVILGFAIAIGQGVTRALSANDFFSRKEGAVEASLVTAALVIALVESYLFSRFSYLSLILFSLPAMAKFSSTGPVYSRVRASTLYLKRLVFSRPS